MKRHGYCHLSVSKGLTYCIVNKHLFNTSKKAFITCKVLNSIPIDHIIEKKQKKTCFCRGVAIVTISIQPFVIYLLLSNVSSVQPHYNALLLKDVSKMLVVCISLSTVEPFHNSSTICQWIGSTVAG